MVNIDFQYPVLSLRSALPERSIHSKNQWLEGRRGNRSKKIYNHLKLKSDNKFGNCLNQTGFMISQTGIVNAPRKSKSDVFVSIKRLSQVKS